MKQYFDLDKQIVHLAIDKSVMFEHAEIKVAETMLRDYNYRNFVSCSKIKFAELIGSSLVMYKTASFKEWKSYFEMDGRVSKHLMGNLIDFERTINSRVSHHISQLMENNLLSNFERNVIIQIISQTKDRRDVNFSQYNGKETWIYVPKMTLGEMKELLFWLFKNKYAIYFEIVKEYMFLHNKSNAKKRFDEINRLRNNLFHFKPINVYITHGSQSNHRKLNNKYRKDAVKFILGLNRNRKTQFEVKQIFENSDNYVKIKNSQLDVG